MDGFDLFYLGRLLTRLGEQAIPYDGIREMSGATWAILFDAVENPGSSISEITARVRFPQSQVSACVNRLRAHGVVETRQDPADRRRTVVHLSARMQKEHALRPPAPIDTVLAEAIGTADPATVVSAVEALTTLSALLNPRPDLL